MPKTPKIGYHVIRREQRRGMQYVGCKRPFLGMHYEKGNNSVQGVLNDKKPENNWNSEELRKVLKNEVSAGPDLVVLPETMVL